LVRLALVDAADVLHAPDRPPLARPRQAHVFGKQLATPALNRCPGFEFRPIAHSAIATNTMKRKDYRLDPDNPYSSDDPGAIFYARPQLPQ